MSTRKRITELSVAELRTQLGKRGIEATGDRPALISKLKKALQDEGVKPKQTRSAAAAAAVAASDGTSDASGAQSAAEPQPMKIQEDPSRSESDGHGPADTSKTNHDTSATDVSMLDSSSTDAGALLAEDSSFVTKSPNTSALDNSSRQMSPQKNATPTSVSDAVTATKIAADEGGKTATESPVPATSDKLVDSITLSSPGTSLTTSPERKKNEKTDVSVDKSNVSEDRSGNVTTSAPVVNKTSGMEDDNAGGDNSLWVSGLTSAFRAADLKQLFGKFGKVVTAKVVTSAKSPGSKCFGFIVLSTAEEAQQAIDNLNDTEVQGQTITVEKDRQKRAILQPQAAAAKPVQATTTLWINGLSTDTKAADLKMLFIKYGKVTGAKVVTSAKNPGTKCFGLVTMSSAAEADLCVERLNKTEFHGRIISLEKAKSEVKTQTKPSVPVSMKAATEANSSAVKKADEEKSAVSKAAAETTSEKEQKDVTESNAAATADDSKPKEAANDAKKDKNMLSLDKIKEQRERERQMQKERAAREAERRRLRELERERRLQQEEAARVVRERERLRQEKMRLERERMKAERARMELEQERHRQERELAQERERMERQQRESRQQAQSYRSDVKRLSGSGDDAYWPPSKRQAMETRDQSYSYNMYGSSSGSYYEKSGQYGTSERRDTQLRSRESDKGGSSATSAWASRLGEHRSSAMASYGGVSGHKPLRAPGATMGEWQSSRGSTGNYSQITSESSRQYGSSSSAAANHPYFGGSGNQSYGKWY